ncbi:hypothetical protein [Christiangramia portivictoriae]|uniref:hypothetical protein n=1 Tax=Christiangramia portivictoriae TaxID=326069 RepID=UPI00042779CD|nr:hypothetical protein [Christiangramia portivictoriae]
MHNNHIIFKQQRELGEILSVTFKFIRENYKTGLRLFFKLVGPSFILLVAAISFYTYATLGSSLFTNGNLEASNVIIALILLMIAYLAYFTSMTGTINHIILSYINNNGKIQEEEVKSGLKQDFGKILLLSILTGIITFAAFMFFVIPGIYVFVPLSLVTAILVFRRNGVTDSISESFQLVKDNWWMTFATLLCIYLVIYVIGLIFQLPALIYIFIRAFTVAAESSAAEPQDMFGTGYVIINAISSAIQYIIYSMTVVGVAFVYFHLNEKKNFTGTYETIQNLGKNR